MGFSLAVLVWRLPHLSDKDVAILRQFPPKALEQLVAQRDVLLEYARAFPASVAVRLCFLYIFLQTFAIPGTIWLSILSGALYGALRGFVLVSVVSTIGALSCFLMSFLIGRPLVRAIWPERLSHYGKEVQARKSDLLNYIIFLRVTPIFPNVFINVASPIVDVPVLQFTAGTLLGCMPNNFVFCNAGGRLGELQSFADLYDVKLLLLGCVVGVAAMVPVVWTHVHKKQSLKLQSAQHAESVPERKTQ
ncbi:hypothetical protein WJX73_009252 [Symbiochloris irregularis]|uniref:VTT domain-containing protein n=1 Tax=Symbiochloris irregularis TaxID=706552 RepID=A0AAW1NUU6_9CHLO